MNDAPGSNLTDHSGHDHVGYVMGTTLMNQESIVPSEPDGGSLVMPGVANACGVRASSDPEVAGYRPYAIGSQRTFTMWLKIYHPLPVISPPQPTGGGAPTIFAGDGHNSKLLTMTGVTGGTFKLCYGPPGGTLQLTANIAYNANATAISNAIEALSNVQLARFMPLVGQLILLLFTYSFRERLRKATINCLPQVILM